MGVPLGCNKFKAKRDGLGFSFESCRGELGAFALKSKLNIKEIKCF